MSADPPEQPAAEPEQPAAEPEQPAAAASESGGPASSVEGASAPQPGPERGDGPRPGPRWVLIAAGIALPALILLSRTGEDDDEKPLPPPPPAPAAVVAAAPASGAPLPPPPAPEVPEVCRPVVDAAERANAKLKCPSSELAMLGGFCDRISRMSPECIGKWKKLTDCVVAAPVSFWSCTQEGMDFESPACSALLPPIQKCF